MLWKNLRPSQQYFLWMWVHVNISMFALEGVNKSSDVTVTEVLMCTLYNQLWNYVSQRRERYQKMNVNEDRLRRDRNRNSLFKSVTLRGAETDWQWRQWVTDHGAFILQTPHPHPPHTHTQTGASSFTAPPMSWSVRETPVRGADNDSPPLRLEDSRGHMEIVWATNHRWMEELAVMRFSVYHSGN